MKKDKKSVGILTSILLAIGVLVWGAASSSISSTLEGIFTPITMYVKHTLLPPPETQIISAIDGHNKSILASRRTTSNEVTLNFRANGPYGISHFQCSLDKMADFSDCPNPNRFDDLQIGSQHVIYVKAFDKLDDSGSPTNLTISVDKSPPRTIITHVIDKDDAPLKNGSFTTSPTITFIFNGFDDAAVSKFVCNFDDSIIDDCTSPKTYPDPTRGKHTFVVYAVDNYGTRDYNPPKVILNVGSSGFVTGSVIKLNKPYSGVQVVIDNKFKSVTGPAGRFIIQNVPTDTPHNITILDQDNNLEYVGESFLTLQNDEAKELSPLIVDTDLILVKKNQTVGYNEMYINYKPEKSQLIRPIDLEYGQKNLKKPSANGPGLWNVTVGVFGPGKVLSGIDKVTYYLHPTFKPDVVTRFNSADNFSLVMKVYGGFKIYAKVYFKDGAVIDLSRFLFLF